MGRDWQRRTAVAQSRLWHFSVPTADTRRLRHGRRVDHLLRPGGYLRRERVHPGHRQQEGSAPRRLQCRVLVQHHRGWDTLPAIVCLRAAHCPLLPHARTGAPGPLPVPQLPGGQHNGSTASLLLPQPDGEGAQPDTDYRHHRVGYRGRHVCLPRLGQLGYRRADSCILGHERVAHLAALALEADILVQQESTT